MIVDMRGMYMDHDIHPKSRTMKIINGYTMAFLGGAERDIEEMTSMLTANDAQLGPLSHRVSIPEYCRKLITRGCVVTIRSEGTEIAGLAAFYANDTGSREAFLSMMVVAEKHRRKGLGRWLLERFEESAMKQGMHTLRLEVQSGNVAARNMYAAFGFVDECASGPDFIYMVKRIR
jgi:ribosomal protein S18 acetylase RimI-like enzyme